MPSLNPVGLHPRHTHARHRYLRDLLPIMPSTRAPSELAPDQNAPPPDSPSYKRCRSRTRAKPKCRAVPTRIPPRSCYIPLTPTPHVLSASWLMSAAEKCTVVETSVSAAAPMCACAVRRRRRHGGSARWGTDLGTVSHALYKRAFHDLQLAGTAIPVHGDQRYVGYLSSTSRRRPAR